MEAAFCWFVPSFNHDTSGKLRESGNDICSFKFGPFFHWRNQSHEQNWVSFVSSKTTCIKVASFTLRRWCLPFVGCKCAWSIHVSSGWCGERKTKTRWVSFSPNIIDFCHLLVLSVLQSLVPLLSLGFREIHSFVRACKLLWCLCCGYVKIRLDPMSLL